MVLSKAKYKIWVKVRKIITFLTDAFCVIMIGLGYTENSLAILIARIGVSAILESINVWLNPTEQ